MNFFMFSAKPDRTDRQRKAKVYLIKHLYYRRWTLHTFQGSLVSPNFRLLIIEVKERVT